MRQRAVVLLIVLSLGANWLLLAPPRSYAECSPDPAPDGSTVTCTGTETDGVSGGAGVTVEIIVDAAVSNADAPTDATIALGNNADVNNDGGSIVASSTEHAVIVGDGSTYTQTDDATISAGMDGIHAGDNASITLEGGEVVAQNGDGIDADDNAQINNQAVIESNGGNGIETDDAATITNSGTITAECDGVESGNTVIVNNSGSITSTGCNVIDAQDNALILNDGTLTTSEDNMNAGVYIGDDGAVYNRGEIETGCKAIKAGESTYVFNTGEITSHHCDGIAAEGAEWISNAGTIVAWDDGVDVNSGSVVNDGTITAGDDGIDIDGGDAYISNAGTITGNVGINADGEGSQSVTNYGEIEGTGGTAVDLGGGMDIFTGWFGNFFNTIVESDADGVVDGGDDEDEFIIGYYYNEDDEEAAAAYSQVEEAANNAATTGCPCTLSFTILGVSFNYVYNNFERIKAIKEGWREYPEYESGDANLVAAEIAPVVEAVEASVTSAETIADQPVIEAAVAPAQESAPVIESYEIPAEMVVEAAPVVETASVVTAAFVDATPASLFSPGYLVNVFMNWATW